MSYNTKGKSLELFFIDGKPDGMLTAEVFNWTGYVLVTPRTQIADALKRPESRFTGIYVLLGEHEGESLAYIGEGENIAERIKNHDANKDWWSQAILVTASSNNLNKAHVKYLESRLIDEARSIGRIKLENGNSPSLPSLSEAACANMEGFLEYLLIVLPAVRVDMFLRKTRPTIQIEEPSTEVFELLLKKENIRATAILAGGEFVVQAGSHARMEWIGDRKIKTSYWKLHDELVEQGILITDNGNQKFAENYAFSSTSAAGAVVNGRSTAGPIAWKIVGTGQTYKDWEAEKLAGDDSE